MTNEEAIRRLRDHFAIHDDGRPTPYLNEAVRIAYEALEKQMPKKPTYVKESQINGITFDWECPLCKREYVNCRYGVAHCPDCGQAIDWSDA